MSCAKADGEIKPIHVIRSNSRMPFIFVVSFQEKAE
jgi:hypothetical protein